MSKRFLSDELRQNNYKLYHENYRREYKQELKEKSDHYRKTHKKQIKIRDKIYKDTHQYEIKKYAKIFYKELKIEVINHYGGKCQCCGEVNIKFLTIDHTNNNGAASRKKLKISAGTGTYRWLVKNNFPEGFQVLCYNCNCGKGYNTDNPGVCPHKEEI